MKIQYTCFFPIYGLAIDPKINGEINVEQVNFVSAAKISRVRKRLGLPHRVSEYQSRVAPSGVILFNDANVYAVVRSNREPDQKSFELEYSRAKDAFYLLVSSLLASVDRGAYSISLYPPSANQITGKIVAFPHNSRDFVGRSEMHKPPLTLDVRWKGVAAHHGYFHLLHILAKKTKTHANWRAALRESAVLAGQSQLSRSLHHAFLLDMIAIENLLARRGDKFPDVLIDRIVGLFGWLTNEDRGLWAEIVTRLYGLRCSFVHDAYTADITGMDLFNADTILKNLLLNLSRNTSLFKSKEDLIEFSEKLEARRTLGMRVRTGHEKLYYLRRAINAHRINDTSSWTD